MSKRRVQFDALLRDKLAAVGLWPSLLDLVEQHRKAERKHLVSAAVAAGHRTEPFRLWPVGRYAK